MEIFSYNEDSYAGNGEAFLFGDDTNAISIFRYPNNNNLKGIGLHVHHECDDIDLLVKGEKYFSNDGVKFFKVKAPAIIANLEGTPHCLVVNENSESLMYGFRSPFKGGEVVSENVENKKSKVFDLLKCIDGFTNLLNSKYSVVNVYKNCNQIKSPFKNNAFVNLSCKNIKINNFEMKDLDVARNISEIIIHESNSLLIEFVTKESK